MDNKEPTADLMQLSVKLSTLRKKSGCEQRSVAKAVGVAASALSAFENGQRIPSLEQTVALAQYYGVSVDWLCGLSETQSNDDSPSKFSRADVLQHLTALCETKLPVSITPDTFQNSDLVIPTGVIVYGKQTRGLTIRLGSEWLQEFGVKYEHLLRLYLEKEIDSEVLQAWKEKKLSECKGNYNLGDYNDDDLPF